MKIYFNIDYYDFNTVIPELKIPPGSRRCCTPLDKAACFQYVSETPTKGLSANIKSTQRAVDDWKPLNVKVCYVLNFDHVMKHESI